MFWKVISGLLIIGYVSLGRPFAYLGIPSAHLFIGEIVLVAFLCFQSRAILDRWYLSLSGMDNLGALSWSLFAFLACGILQMAHGIYLGYPFLTAFESVAFHVYPLYLFVGMFVGSLDAGFLRKTILWLAGWNCIYGLAYIFYLNRLPWTLPGTDALIFSGVGGGSLVLLGLLSFELRLTRLLIPVLVNAFLMLAMAVRSEWLGFGLGVFAWGLLSRRLGRVAFGLASIAILLAAGYAFDFSFPSPVGRGGNISFEDIVGRAIASVDSEKAREFTRSAGQYAGTVTWRTTWWSAIWDSVHGDPATAMFGHGYGYPLGDLVPFLKNVEIRTPHNVFFYALGYSGWTGVLVFFMFQAALGRALWQTYRLTGQPFGIVLWLMAFSSSFLGNLFETPFGAIPLYLVVGAALSAGARVEYPVTDEDHQSAPLVDTYPVVKIRNLPPTATAFEEHGREVTRYIARET